VSQTSVTAFDTLPLPAAQIRNLNSLGYLQMTPIQQQSLPILLAGQDLIAQAQTGSGKTAAFGIGLLERLQPARFEVQSLVLCPTRELATQVAAELRRLARYLDNIKVLTLCGGMPIGPQIGSLEHGAHIVVGTPGRIRDHLRKGTLLLERVNTLVLDEADRMLDMGFAEDIGQIIAMTPLERQTLLFSATYPPNIDALSRDYQRTPQRVQVESTQSKPKIAQSVYACDDADKAEALIALLQRHRPEAAVLFCNTRQHCMDIAQALKTAGYRALTLHGELEQRDRDQTLVQFTNGSAHLLIATDVAARGLDIDSVDLVINVDLPRDPAVYTHRIGRTGRAGREGLAISLAGPKDGIKLERIEADLEQPMSRIDSLPAPEQGVVPEKPAMLTIAIAGGRKNKLRPGDIVGALTVGGGLSADDIGQITLSDFTTWVAVRRAVANQALETLRERTIKGKKFRARRL